MKKRSIALIQKDSCSKCGSKTQSNSSNYCQRCFQSLLKEKIKNS